MPRNEPASDTLLDLNLYLRHHAKLTALGCPEHVPDEWLAANNWGWFHDVPYDEPIAFGEPALRLDEHLVGVGPGGIVHALRAHTLPTGGILIATIRNGPLVSDISATVASSRHSGSIAIHEELARWDELELQVFDLTSRSAA